MIKDKRVVKAVRDRRLRKRIREKIKGTPDRPRVHIFKSNMYLYTQVIDDGAGAVLAAASTRESAFKEKSKNVKNTKAAEVLGEILARRIKDKKIDSVVFDRGIHRYHGRIKALADAMRKQGIRF